MRLQTFRIKNFRSIIDTGFQNLSPDGISLIVGQNESGKSSVLEGINAFETGEIVEDDIRSNGLLPEVTCIFKFESFQELADILPKDRVLPKNFKKVFEKLERCVSLTRTWAKDNYEEGELTIENIELQNLFELEDAEEESITPSAASVSSEEPLPVLLTKEEFIEETFGSLPLIDMFEDNSLLPPTIDLADLIKKNTKAEGYEGAKNFLLIADIKAEDLQNPQTIRIVEDILEVKSKRVNVELQKYWHQTVGKKDKIEVVVELKNHPSTTGKPGEPYLTFWIRDKNGRLSPVQRSKGVKWFISFYLKLEATAKTASRRIFLIDEPGANLHAKAQEDILSIFEKQKDNLQIIFTTHSPYLLDVGKVYRVNAVEREGTEDEKSETKVIPFHKLGSASIDTLLPLYTNMGVDVSHQSVISKQNNVLLEEISAFFYLKAFWKLFNRIETVHFLPATGCPNLPLLANLMLGWRLSFSVVLDDEPHGRKVLKELKDSQVCEERNLMKIDGCSGIEDLFTKTDFAKIILENTEAKIGMKSNSEYVKDEKISKVIIARNFMIGVNDGTIKYGDLSKDSKDKIETLLLKIVSTLEVVPTLPVITK